MLETVFFHFIIISFLQILVQLRHFSLSIFIPSFSNRLKSTLAAVRQQFMQFRDFVPILSARKHLTLSDVDQEGFPLSELLENLEKVNAWSSFFSFL